MTAATTTSRTTTRTSWRMPGEPAIRGTTRLAGVIGWPVEHSRSPQMHNAAYAALGLDWAYVPLAGRRPSGWPTALRGLAALGFAGVNVTIPHKEGVAALVRRAVGRGPRGRLGQHRARPGRRLVARRDDGRRRAAGRARRRCRRGALSCSAPAVRRARWSRRCAPRAPTSPCPRGAGGGRGAGAPASSTGRCASPPG